MIPEAPAPTHLHEANGAASKRWNLQAERQIVCDLFSGGMPRMGVSRETSGRPRASRERGALVDKNPLGLARDTQRSPLLDWFRSSQQIAEQSGGRTPCRVHNTAPVAPSTALTAEAYQCFT